MKKKLGSQIQQLAKKLLISEENFNTTEIKKEVTQLLEKLSVLEFLEAQNNDDEHHSPTSALDSKSYREENWFKEPEPVPEPENKEEIVEPLIEKIKDLIAQMPFESQKVDDLLEEILPKKKHIKNDLEEFASRYQETPTFERKTAIVPPVEIPPEDALVERSPSKGVDAPSGSTNLINDKGISEKPKSINDAVKGSLKIGLNDRLAFIKHLFDGGADDYQRVLSQLNTFQSFEEADSFINGQVKPDYNYWLQKDEFTDRFMAIVEKKFN